LADFKKSPLKPLDQVNRKLVGQVSDYLAKQFQRRFLEIDQSETRIACGGHVCKWIGTK
jgi:hypothetical protein